MRTVIPGAFSVSNTLEAAACASCLGISPAVISQAICALSGVSGRMERVRIGTADYSVFIDYAHTPDALWNVLNTIRSLKQDERRLVLVFGCGGDRDKTKRPVMGKIASELADLCVVTSDNSRSEDPMDIIKDITEGMWEGTYVVIPKRADAIDYVIREAVRGDVILLAGKGHEEYEIDRDGKHPFCEREIVKAAVHRYSCDILSDKQNNDGGE